MDINAKKLTQDLTAKIAPHLQNATLFYAAAAGLFILTLIFIAYPAYANITGGYDQIKTLNQEIEATTSRKELLYSDYNALKTRINKSHSEVDAAIQAEVLPSEPQETELVRYFERKTQQFNVSSRDFLELASVSFSKPKTDVDNPYISVKLNMIGSYENFYRFLQVLEQSGLIVEIDDVERFSAAYQSGFKEGDVVEYVIINQGEEDEERSPILFPWVLSEEMKSLSTGEEMDLQIRRYNEKTGFWERKVIAYKAEEKLKGTEEAETGMKLILSDEYSRQMSVQKISAKVIEGDEITGEGERVEFSVELLAYFIPREEN